jgi:uncharacterized protein YecT (DUF1311 family)
MTKKTFLFLLFIAFSLCHSLSAQTQLEMNQTADKKFKKADTELNQVYKQLIKILDKNEKQLLIQAQKDWLRFRDSHCKFDEAQYDGGSIQPLIYSTCLEESTRKRIKELKTSIKNRQQ